MTKLRYILILSSRNMKLKNPHYYVAGIVMGIFKFHIHVSYWIGHTLRKEVGAIEKTASDRNPQGYRRVRRMWRRTIGDEIRGTGKSWNEVK
jgi:hypothetical protein